MAKSPVAKGQVWSVDEDDIHRTILNNTPPRKRDKFHDLYRRIHGRPIPDASALTWQQNGPFAKMGLWCQRATLMLGTTTPVAIAVT